MSRLINVLLFISLLTACRHNYTVRDRGLAVDNQWSAPIGETALAEKELSRKAWWTGFHDETLNELIKRGFSCNNSLNKSRGEIQAAQGELEKIRYQWIPTLDTMMGYSRNPMTNFPGSVIVIIPNYTINVFYQIKEQKRAKYRLAVAKAEDDALKLTVISQIAAAYFTYQAEIERKELLNRLAEDTTELAQISKRVYRDGLDADINPQIRYSEANLIYGAQDVLDSNIVSSRNAIRYLINKNPGELKTSKHFSDISTHHLIPGQLPLTVLETRPDMQVAENKLRASNEAIDLAASHWLPSIQLDLIEGFAAGNSKYSWATKPVYFNDQLLKSPLIRFTVLGEVAKAKGLNKAAFYNYMDTLKKALRDTTNALVAHDRINQKLKETESAQKHLAKAYELNVRLYKRGIQSYVTTLTSKILLDEVNIAVNRNKLEQLLTIVEVYRELAGGYRADKPTK